MSRSAVARWIDRKVAVQEPMPAAAAIVQRSPADDPLGPQSAGQCACGGGCPGCAGSIGLQPKLLVGALDDPMERAADQSADAIVGGGGGPLGGATETDDAAATVAPAAVHQLAGSTGRGLDPPLRRSMESAFGTDFGGVRIHTDDRAGAAAAAVRARAYTLGSDVVFGAGQFDPHSAAGRHTIAHELAHVVQQQASGPRPIRRQGGGGFSLRSPSLEVAAIREQAAFSSGGRPLMADERAVGASVFQGSVDLDRVRIVRSPIISAPTTLGNTIRTQSGTMDTATLVHELTHVWQYQTKGSGYISDSIFHQLGGILIHFDRNAAYAVTIVPGKSIHAYPAEHQAMIVQTWYSDPGARADPEYQRLIAQVRASRPIVAPRAFFEEMAAGLPPRDWALPGGQPPPFAEGGGVPQLEFRFPGL